MSIATPGAAERARLDALASYQILDTPREAVFDRIARTAAQMCGVRLATVAFVDRQREWFKAHEGFERDAVARENGFADATINADFLEVPDCSRDERFERCPLVRDEPHVRFYAGVPLRSPHGYAVGTLAVMSRAPHALTTAQREALRDLAIIVVQLLEERRELRTLFAENETAQEQISLLLSAVDAAADAISIYRVDPSSGDLVLEYMNEGYARQTGYTREQALGRRLEQLRQAMPEDPGMEQLRDAIAQAQTASAQIVSYRKDGSSFWNQVTLHPIRGPAGEITHWIAVERDVTEKLEPQSQDGDRQVSLLLLLSAARRFFGAPDYRTLVQRLQEAMRELIGATVIVHEVAAGSDVVDSLVERAAHAREHVCDEDRFRAATAVGAAEGLQHVIEISAPSGRTLCTGDLFVLDLLGEYFGVALRNASLVAELEDRRSAILELNQVKTDLVAMLAHDFKGPLTSIVGFTELAMDLGEINPDQREYLESVKRLALRLSDLASDTLAFSRLERNEIALALADVDLAAMANEAAQAFTDQRTIIVSVKGDAVVRGDANRLRQVLFNLMENAIKYSPGGEPIEMRVRPSTSCGTQTVRVQVIDRGIGIPRQELKSVFGRFSRASNARKLHIAGTGFGLYLARQIVELHGGTIAASSAEGKGSTFTVELPRAGAAAYETPLSVAVIAPERESRSFIAQAMREAGFRVHVHQSIEELVEWLDVEHVDTLAFDLDDVRLTPEQVDALEAARKRVGFTIVAVGEPAGLFPQGATRLAKPFLVQDLVAAIRSRPE